VTRLVLCDHQSLFCRETTHAWLQLQALEKAKADGKTTHDSTTTEKRGEYCGAQLLPVPSSWIGARAVYVDCTRSWHGKIGCDVDVSVARQGTPVKVASVAYAPTGLAAACIGVRVQEPAPESIALRTWVPVACHE
jgi:hypothetical protein